VCIDARLCAWTGTCHRGVGKQATLLSGTCDSVLLEVYSMGSRYLSFCDGELLSRSCVFTGDNALPAIVTLQEAQRAVYQR
jgi:hypothetical protein